MKRAQILYGISTGLLFLALGCSNTDFSGSSPKKPAVVKKVEPVEKSLSLLCENGQTQTSMVSPMTGTSKTSVVLNGEFCDLSQQTVSGELSVLFLLDFSGSMYDNDLEVGGGCGRLEAAKAITSKLKSTIPTGVDVNIGILPFGTNAQSSTSMVPLASFDQSLTQDSFCGFSMGSTNYDDAFDKARDVLTARQGKSVIYFISDGVPTVSGTGIFGFGQSQDPTQAQEEGVSSAEQLRSALGDRLDLNAIFINTNPAGTFDTDLPNFDPQTYLQRVTGDPQKVRLVSNASELADQIVSFETPEVLSIDTSSVVAVLSASAFGNQPVEIQSVAADPMRSGVWTFATKPFPLYGEQGRVVNNEVTISVNASDGQSQSAKVTIPFTVDDE